jgi:hypothetical protein
MSRTFGQFNERWADLNRTPRRQRLVRHVIACGDRAVLEALLAVAAGEALDRVLEDYARLPPEIFRATGADVMPIDELLVVNGSRRS